MIKLSYSTFGLTNLDFLDAISVVDKAGYPGIELSFHRDQFNPHEITDEYLAAIKQRLGSVSVKAVCMATASHFFTPSRPHEPSLICPDLAGRKRRINLIRRGIEVARELGIPLVTFGSGFIRDEHVMNPSVDPNDLLVDSIHQCLQAISAGEDITLLIEPEPGMFIETVSQGLSLLEAVNSPHFQLHLDLCHMYCSEHDYISALARAAPYTRFLHVSDAREGYNLKIIKTAENLDLDLDFASYLIYFPAFADYLLVDRHHPLYFFDEKPGKDQENRVRIILKSAGIQQSPAYVDYNRLFAGSSPYDDEIFTYLISVPGLSYDVLERARPILIYLRSEKDTDGRSLVDKMVANTLTGIVHFHEIPGEGTLDFSASFKALNEHGFSGYASVELYHHVEAWEKALNDSYTHLYQFT
ncbi:MAG: sugar phosphate isomerase/epimerase family protein [Anaerolineales bacterium]